MFCGGVRVVAIDIASDATAIASAVFAIVNVATDFRNAMLQLLSESGGVGMIGGGNYPHSNSPGPILAPLAFDVIVMISHARQHTCPLFLNLITPCISPPS